MRHLRCKICPDSMFQKWQLWTKLHKFQKTAQLASPETGRAHRVLAGASRLNTIWDNSGTKLETATVSTKFEGPRDGQERIRGQWRLKDGWPGPGILFVFLFTGCVVSVSVRSGGDWDPVAKCANHLDHSQLGVEWEEGGIFRLLKVHLLHFQQVPVSNEGNDECFCVDELACAGVAATVITQVRPSSSSAISNCPLNTKN